MKAYRIARAVSGAEERWGELEAAVGDIDAGMLRGLLDNVDWLVESTARWFLNNQAGQQPIDATIEQFAADYEILAESIGSSGPAAWQQARHNSTAELRTQGVPEKIAKRHAHIEDLVHGPDIIELAQQTGRSVGEVSGVFFRLGKSVRIDWLEDEASRLEPANRWERLAKQAAAGDLVVLRRKLAEKVLARTSGRDAVSPGEYVTAVVDRMMAHEAFAACGGILQSTGISKLHDPDRLVVVPAQFLGDQNGGEAGTVQDTFPDKGRENVGAPGQTPSWGT